MELQISILPVGDRVARQKSGLEWQGEERGLFLGFFLVVIYLFSYLLFIFVCAGYLFLRAGFL